MGQLPLNCYCYFGCFELPTILFITCFCRFKYSTPKCSLVYHAWWIAEHARNNTLGCSRCGNSNDSWPIPEHGPSSVERLWNSSGLCKYYYGVIGMGIERSSWKSKVFCMHSFLQFHTRASPCIPQSFLQILYKFDMDDFRQMLTGSSYFQLNWSIIMSDLHKTIDRTFHISL